MTRPGDRLRTAIREGDLALAVEAAYEVGRSAAARTLRAGGEIPAHWPGAFEDAEAKVSELLERFGTNTDMPSFPENFGSYIYVSVRRVVEQHLAYMMKPGTAIVAPEYIEHDDDDLDFAPNLLQLLVARNDHEAATALAVALDLASRGDRPTARSIHAELAHRHATLGEPRGPQLWRVEKAWTRVREAARDL